MRDYDESCSGGRRIKTTDGIKTVRFLFLKIVKSVEILCTKIFTKFVDYSQCTIPIFFYFANIIFDTVMI